MADLDDRMQPGDIPSAPPSRPERSWGSRQVLSILLGVGIVAVALYNIAAWVRQNRLDSRFAPQRAINLKQPERPSGAESVSTTEKTRSLRVAIAPVISPEKSLQTYGDFVDYVARKLDKSPVFLQGETYGKVNDLVRYGRCDVALVCTSAFVRGEREFGMKVLVVPEIGGAITYHSLFLVPQSSRAASLLDLRGKRFASADILSNSGWLYPVTWLRDRGEDPEVFFGDHVITGSHDRSVEAVASGYVDGAAVDHLVYEQMVEEDPSIAKKTKVILKSPPFGMPPLVVPPGIDPVLEKELRTVLLGMHLDTGGKKILASLRIDRFVVPDESLFDSVREASRAWEPH